MTCTYVFDFVLGCFRDFTLPVVVLALNPYRFVIQKVYHMVKATWYFNNPSLHLVVLVTFGEFNLAKRNHLSRGQDHNGYSGSARGIHDMALDGIVERKLIISVITYPKYLLQWSDEQGIVLTCNYLVD